VFLSPICCSLLSSDHADGGCCGILSHVYFQIRIILILISFEYPYSTIGHCTPSKIHIDASRFLPCRFCWSMLIPLPTPIILTQLTDRSFCSNLSTPLILLYRLPIAGMSEELLPMWADMTHFGVTALIFGVESGALSTPFMLFASTTFPVLVLFTFSRLLSSICSYAHSVQHIG